MFVLFAHHSSLKTRSTSASLWLSRRCGEPFTWETWRSTMAHWWRSISCRTSCRASNRGWGCWWTTTGWVIRFACIKTLKKGSLLKRGGRLLTHTGPHVQRSAGCNCRSPTDREVPAYCQLDQGGWVQKSPPLPLEGPAHRHGGGRLRKTSGRVFPGRQMWATH